MFVDNYRYSNLKNCLAAFAHCQALSTNKKPTLASEFTHWYHQGDSLRYAINCSTITPGHLQPNTVGLHKTCPFESQPSG